MKSARILAVILVIALAFVISGCKPKVWAFDFRTASGSELDEWYIDDYGGDVTHTDFGTILDYMGIASPVSFDGDWTMYVTFWLEVDDNDQVYFELYPGDDQGWEPDNYIWSYFDYVGWTSSEYEEWYVDDTGPSSYDVIIDKEGIIPGLNRDGRNVWRIEKVGNKYKTFINAQKLSDFTAVYCRGARYYLNLYAELDGGILKFEEVKVEYKGKIYAL